MKIDLSTRMVRGFVIGCVLTLCGPTACSTVPKSERARLAKLETKLRRANFKIESLREMNAVLKKRIKIAKAHGIADPQLATDALAAFKPGVQLEVPVTERRTVSVTQRQDVSLVARKLPAKRARGVAALPSNVERADVVLASTVADLLKSGDTLEAERTAALLEKSYPDSELIAETRFQLGLHFFRAKNFPRADRLFEATLRAPKAHIRAKAGGVLMRGIIARRLAAEGAATGRTESVVQTNLALARRSFEYVRKAFPSSPEAKRAGRELQIMSSSSFNASRVK